MANDAGNCVCSSDSTEAGSPPPFLRRATNADCLSRHLPPTSHACHPRAHRPICRRRLTLPRCPAQVRGTCVKLAVLLPCILVPLAVIMGIAAWIYHEVPLAPPNKTVQHHYHHR